MPCLAAFLLQDCCTFQTELLDEFSLDQRAKIHVDSPDSPKNNEIGFGAAAFSWSNENVAGGVTPSQRRFKLRIDDELVFERGCINLIVGSTGSLLLY